MSHKPAIDHKGISAQIVDLCAKKGLDADKTTKVLIYTATKLIAKQYERSDVQSARLLSRAALTFSDEIARCERMFSTNKDLN